VARPGAIVVLNGAPRSGKSSIVAAVQEASDRPWLNLGVDVWAHVPPPALRPGIGLRPGGEAPDVEALVPLLYAGLYASVAAHSRLGLDVVVDVGHHEGHGARLGTLADAAARLDGLPAWLVGVRCPLDVVLARRAASPAGSYAVAGPDGAVPEVVRRWQRLVHEPGVYDLEVDTSTRTPADLAADVLALVAAGRPTAFAELRRRTGTAAG
jgi:chloramphenicol 3-O phosphotransferase